MLSSQGFQHQSNAWVPLRPMARSSWLEHVAERWAANVVGQPQATDAILRLLQRIEAQARQPRQTMGSVLLLGPPGCGKTHSVEALATVLLGNPGALLKVNCAEYQQQHETARLVGARRDISATPTLNRSSPAKTSSATARLNSLTP